MIAGHAAVGIFPERWNPEAFPRLRLMPRADVSQDGGAAPPVWERRDDDHIRQVEDRRPHRAWLAAGWRDGVHAGGEHTTRSDGRRRGRVILRGGSGQEATGSPYGARQPRAAVCRVRRRGWRAAILNRGGRPLG